MTLASMKSLYSQLIRYERESPTHVPGGSLCSNRKMWKTASLPPSKSEDTRSHAALLMSSVALIRGLISLYVSVDLLTVDMDTIPRTWAGCRSW